MDKTIFPKLKHKNGNCGNIAHVDNLQKNWTVTSFVCVIGHLINKDTK